MSKSIKLKDNTFIDSTGIVHDKKLLSELLNVNESIKTKTYTNKLVANSNVSPFNSWCNQDVSDINGVIIHIDARNSWNAPLLATKVGSNINVVGNMSTGAGVAVYITVTYIDM